MTATRKGAILVLIICTANLILSAELGTSPQDVVYACKGGAAHLQWKPIIDPEDEEVKNVHWFFHRASSKDNVANYNFGQFVSAQEYDIKASQFQQYGVTLYYVTEDDAGNYSVEYLTSKSNASVPLLVSQSHTMFLQVSDGPMVKRGRLEVTQDPAPLWNTTSHQWTIRLLCGFFTFLGQPPIQVEWIMPGGEVQTSSGYMKDHFYLSLLSPVVHTGNYTCHLPQQFHREACFETKTFGDRPLVVEATIVLDELRVQQALENAEIKQLRQEKERLQDNVTRLADDMKHQSETLREEYTTSNEDMKHQLTDMTHQLKTLLEENTKSKEETKTELKQIQKTLREEDIALQDMKHQLADMKHQSKTLREEYTSSNKDMNHQLKDMTHQLKDMTHQLKTLLEKYTKSKEDTKNEQKQIQKTLREEDVLSNQACSEINYRVLSEDWRATSHAWNDSDRHCDNSLPAGWYRFKLNGANAVISMSCVHEHHCGAVYPFWLDLQGKSLPGVGQQVVGHACGSFSNGSSGNCCYLGWSNGPVTVRNCGTFYIYNLHPPTGCHLAYCTNSQ